MAWEVVAGDLKVTRKDFKIACERELDKHLSQEDRDDYYQVIRFFKLHSYKHDAVERALKRIRTRATA
jgi:hypothetical protein